MRATKQRDPAARKRANEASIAASWALLGYFFEMLARTAWLPHEEAVAHLQPFDLAPWANFPAFRVHGCVVPLIPWRLGLATHCGEPECVEECH